jgi:hypothetical protein
VGVLLCICDCGTNFLHSESKLQRQIDRNRTELVFRSHRRGVAGSPISDMVWLYRSAIPVGREGVFYLPMLITTCLSAAKRGEDVDSSLSSKHKPKTTTAFKWTVLYKEDQYSPPLFFLLKSIKKTLWSSDKFLHG